MEGIVERLAKQKEERQGYYRQKIHPVGRKAGFAWAESASQEDLCSVRTGKVKKRGIPRGETTL